jgi:hypothetical protein
LVVYGSVVLGGRDSVRLRAEVLNLSGGETARPMSRFGATRPESITSPIPSRWLSCARSAVIAPSQRSGTAPSAGVSLPALKEYLQGEQLYRHSLWDSALVHYSRATELDSSFALAYRRMYLVLGWTPSTQMRFESRVVYGLKAAA